MANPRDYLLKISSSASLLRFALPSLINDKNPSALKACEVEKDRTIRSSPAEGLEKDIPRLTTLKEIEQNVEAIVPQLANALMTWARRAERKEEEVVLFLDMPAVQSEEVKRMLNDRIIKPLMRVNGNNGDIKRILKTLTIAERDDKEKIERRMARKKNPLKSKNVIIMTDASRIDDFDKFTNSIITALDLSALNKKEKFNEERYYYPYVEAAFFAVIRALVSDKNDLLIWYNAVPNVKRLSEDELIKMCFDANGILKKRVILELMPDAPDFNPNDLRRLYEKIEKFIRKA